MKDWKKRYHHSGVTLDLILDGGKCDPRVSFDESLQDAVRSHVVRHTIREVRLRSDDGVTLSSIISLLAPDDEDAWNENIESIIWQNNGTDPVELSQISSLGSASRSCICSTSPGILELRYRTAWHPEPHSSPPCCLRPHCCQPRPRLNCFRSSSQIQIFSNSACPTRPPQMKPIGPHSKCRCAT